MTLRVVATAERSLAVLDGAQREQAIFDFDDEPKFACEEYTYFS